MVVMIGLNQASATTFTNGSFETGDFTGWDTFNSLGSFLGVTGVFASEGINSVEHEFDGFGPGEMGFGQQVTIVAPIIEFDYFASVDNVGLLDRTLDLVVRDGFAGAELYRENILTVAAGSFVNIIPLAGGSVDLSAFLGATVHVSFDSSIPEVFTGPGNVWIDNVRSSGVVVPEPSTYALFALGLGALGIAHRRKTREEKK